MTKPLAVCRRSKHALARMGVRDGSAVIEYRAAVGGMRARTGKQRGRFDVAGIPPTSDVPWSIYPVARTEHESAITDVYCDGCNEMYSVAFLDLLSAHREGRTIVLDDPQPA